MGRPVVVFLLLAVAVVDFSRGQTESIISFRDKDVTADEEDGNAEICLIREGTPGQINSEETVYIRGEQVDDDMMAGSGDLPDPNMATGGDDFGDDPVPIVFQPGDEEKCANLSIVQDSLQEIQEEFQVSLLRMAPNGQLQRINGSEPLPAFIRGQMGSMIRFRDNKVTVNEEDQKANICLIRDGSPSQISRKETVFIQGERADDATTGSDDTNRATPNMDFSDELISVVFESGDTEKCADIPILRDEEDEEEEVFQVSLLRYDAEGEPQKINGTGSLPVVIRGQIRSTIRFRDDRVTVDEEEQKAEICLIRDGTPSQINSEETVFIQGEQVDDDMMAGSGVPDDMDTATSDADFSDELISVVFGSGDTEKCADIPILRDEEDEEEEEFQVRLLRLDDQGEPQRINGTGSLPVFIRDMDGAVVGDPMFTVPLSLPSNTRAHLKTASVGLCYEVHGIEKGIFNLFSDYCVSLNGLFTLATDPSIGNIISKIGIVAVDDDGYCHQISVSLYDRRVMVDGKRIQLHDRHSEAGITIRSVSKDTVRIALPNCKEKKVVFKVQFGEMEGVKMLKLIVGKGQGLSTESHGMMGQFWNTPADLLPSSESDIYRVMIHSMTSGVREFQGDLHPLTWDFQYKPCLYGGDRQGFPVLEGKYKDYKVSGDIFNTDFTYSQFSSSHCQN